MVARSLLTQAALGVFTLGAAFRVRASSEYADNLLLRWRYVNPTGDGIVCICLDMSEGHWSLYDYSAISGGIPDILSLQEWFMGLGWQPSGRVHRIRFTKGASPPVQDADIGSVSLRLLSQSLQCRNLIPSCNLNQVG